MGNNKHIIIATRGSSLALTQANIVKDWLSQKYSNIEVSIKVIKTKADKFINYSLNKIGGEGLFVKELEEALISSDADIAVHSMKDVPTTIPPGLEIFAICKRENPQDVFISNRFTSLSAIPKNQSAIIGTGSVRRQSQLNRHFNNIRFINIRGNIKTRIQTMEKDNLDGIILAYAGIKRLNLEHLIKEIITKDICIPAVGQGAIGIECRTKDLFIKDLIKGINDLESQTCLSAERAFMSVLEGGCQAPIAAYAYIKGKKLFLDAIVSSIDGKKYLHASIKGPINDPQKTGQKAAVHLISKGAKEILDEARNTLSSK